MRIALLIILLASLGFAKPKPSEVLHVVNENSTLDTDANGVYDFQDCLNYWYSLYHDTSHVVRIKTSIQYNTSDNAMSIHWDLFSIDFDTSSTWGQDATVSLAGGNEYILDEICEYMEADSAVRWRQIKYAALWFGMPLKLRHNDKVGNLPTSAYSGDSCIVKSIASALVLFVRPGCDVRPTQIEPNFDNRLVYNSSQYNARFYNYTQGITSLYDIYQRNDTLAIYMLPTVLDADSIVHVRRMLAKSLESPIVNGKTRSKSSWAVIDEAPTHSYTTRQFTDSSYFRNTIRSLFNECVLWDKDSVANQDTCKIGWPGNPTLQSGDSVLFFWCAGEKHSPVPDSSEGWFRQINLKPANGSLTWFNESYFGYSTRGGIRPSGTQTQSLVSDAIAAGYTYAIGQAHEPYASGMTNPIKMSVLLRQRDLPFAVLAHLSNYHVNSLNVPVGNPIGVLNASEKEKNWNSWRRW